MSCDKDELDKLEELEQLDCTQGEFTFKLNGTLWTATSFTNTLVFATDPQTQIDTRRCDIRAKSAEGEQIIITFSNPDAKDDTCMDSGSYISLSNVTSSTDNVFFVTYNESNGGFGFMATEGSLSISECKSEGQREISGTFTFEDVLIDLCNKNTKILLVGMPEQAKYMVNRLDVVPDLVSKDQVFENINDCLTWIKDNFESNTKNLTL